MNTNPVIKLTMVSVTYKGSRKTRFIKALYIDGKAIINDSIVVAMFDIPRGHTYTIG